MQQAAASLSLSDPHRLKKRTKAGVLVSSITYADLETCFGLPTEKACIKLGVGLTILKRLCRKFGIARWPYRTLLKAGKAQRSSPPPPSSPLDALACTTPAGSAGPGCAQTCSAVTPCQPSQSASETSMAGQQQQEQQQQAAAAAEPAAVPPPPPPPVVVVAVPRPAPAPAALPRSNSQLSLLLCAIDAFESPAAVGGGAADGELTPASSPTAPARLPSFQFAAATSPATSPATPSATATAAGVQTPPAPATVFQRRPFAHSRRSAFGLVARRRAAAAEAPPTAEQQLLLLLGLRRQLELQLEQQRAEMAAQHAQQAQQHAAAAAAAQRRHQQAAAQQQQHMDLALQALLGGGDCQYPQDPQVRLRLAEKLAAAREVLQARMQARRTHASQLASHGGGNGRYSPYPTPAQSPAAASPSRGGGEAAAARDAAALRSARSLLAQYSL